MDLLSQARAGWTALQMLEYNPKLANRNIDNLVKLRQLYFTPRDPEVEPDVRLYWGDSGAGKTRTALSEAKEAGKSIYIKPAGSKWWPGYEQQDYVLLDDFNGKFFGDCEKSCLSVMQTLLDRAPMQVETKGGYVQFNSQVIIITSNQPIRSWFCDALWAAVPGDAWYKSLKRRIATVRHFSISAFNPALNIQLVRNEQDAEARVALLNTEDLPDVNDHVERLLGFI